MCKSYVEFTTIVPSILQTGFLRTTTYNSAEYTHSMTCRFLLTAPVGKKVSLQFSSFAVAEDNLDYFEVCEKINEINIFKKIYDGNSRDTTRILAHVGTTIPSAVVSSQFVDFYASRAVQASGVIASFSYGIYLLYIIFLFCLLGYVL